MAASERRRTNRVDVLLSGRWDADGKTTAVGIRNISRLGAGLVAQLPAGQFGILRFVASDEPYDVPSVVAWVDAERALCGVRFMLRREQDQRRIVHLAQHLIGQSPQLHWRLEDAGRP